VVLLPVKRPGKLGTPESGQVIAQWEFALPTCTLHIPPAPWQ
jgi:hypothetical protein